MSRLSQLRGRWQTRLATWLRRTPTRRLLRCGPALHEYLDLWLPPVAQRHSPLRCGSALAIPPPRLPPVAGCRNARRATTPHRKRLPGYHQNAGHRNARRAAARLLEVPPLGYCQTPSDTTPIRLRPPQKITISPLRVWIRSLGRCYHGQHRQSRCFFVIDYARPYTDIDEVKNAETDRMTHLGRERFGLRCTYSYTQMGSAPPKGSRTP